MVAITNSPLSRLRRGIQRYGFIPSCKRFVSNTFNRVFRARLCVWMWKQGDPLIDGSGNAVIERFASVDELRSNDLDELTAGDGPGFKSRMREEFSEGGILWVAYIDGHVAGYQWKGKLRSELAL